MFAHAKFDLVQMKEGGVKRGADSSPRPEPVFEIPAWIGLSFCPLYVTIFSFVRSRTIEIRFFIHSKMHKMKCRDHSW